MRYVVLPNPCPYLPPNFNPPPRPQVLQDFYLQLRQQVAPGSAMPVTARQAHAGMGTCRQWQQLLTRCVCAREGVTTRLHPAASCLLARRLPYYKQLANLVRQLLTTMR